MVLRFLWTVSIFAHPRGTWVRWLLSFRRWEGAQIFHGEGRYTWCIAVSGYALTGNFSMEFCYVDKSWVLEPF